MNEFPPIALSVRVLTTKLRLTVSIGVPAASWYAATPSTAPATNRSLMLPPSALAALLAAASGISNTSR